MFLRKHTPQPPLSNLVDCLWYGEGASGPHTQERLLPNGESSIVFDLRDQPMRVYDAQNAHRFDTYSSAVFCGARSDCFVIDTNQQERVLGVQFRPGGAFPFLRMPASEIASGSFSLDYIWPREAKQIRDRLMCASSLCELFSTLERALLAQLSRPPALHPAVSFAVHRLGTHIPAFRVRDVVDRVGLSSRRFIQLFEDQIGLTPKVFQRVRRFQSVLRTLHADSVDDMAGLALRCGYYDQAHFINDFKIFSGMTPTEYVAVATPHLNHVPLK
jgi:AraC-like DNA-binding protein